jgi:NAD+ diphosphatase
MDHYQRSALNYYAANPIDRMTHKRRDAEWLAEQLKSAEALFIPVWDSKQLFTEGPVPGPIFLPSRQTGELIEAAETIVFLGGNGTTVYFALDLPHDNSSFADSLSEIGRFQDLKRFGALLPAPQAALLAYARAITHWHRNHHFCGKCGSPTASVDGGHCRACANTQCGGQSFPRTDPAIITLIHSGERCLLGRQPVWPKGFFSAIAGFVEPGESLEDAVVREMLEETGITVHEVQYHSSQPWPYPCSIMLGFNAVASDELIRLVDDELEDARWFSREDFEGRLEAGELRLPSNFSIAFRLIEDWYNGAGDAPLRAFLDSIPGYQHLILGRS